MLAKFTCPRQNHCGGFIFSFYFPFLFVRYGPCAAKPAFTARLMNIESATKDPFRFNISLHNGSGRLQVYQLQAQVPEGWIANFRAEGSQVAALRLDSGKTQEISLEITATPAAKPGKYDVPVSAVSTGDSLRLDLEAVVKGSYNLELTTPYRAAERRLPKGETSSFNWY